MNEYDSNRIYDITEKINYKKTENLLEANCYVINTCHIRAVSYTHLRAHET